MKAEKKRQTLLIWLKNLLMATLVVVIVYFLVFVTQGWTLDSKGETRQTGLVQFASTPTGATIEVGDKALFERSNAKALLLPGEYEFKMWREGYETWFNRSQVRAGEILWLNYARLVPKKREVSNFFSIVGLKKAAAASNQQRVLMISDDVNNLPKFSLVDLRSDEPKIKEINLDLSIFFNSQTSQAAQIENLKDLAADLEIVKINHSGDRALIKQTRSGVAQWLLLNLENPELSLNLNEFFHLGFLNLQPIDENMTRFVAIDDGVDGGNLRVLDINSRPASESFVSDVVDFKIFNHEVVAFVKKSGEEFLIGVWKIGEKLTEVVTKTQKMPKLAIARYYNENYLHVAIDKKLDIFKGKSWFGGDRLKFFKYVDMPFAPIDLKTNPEGRMIIATNDQATFVRDLELKQNHELTFAGTKNNNPQMIDNFIFYDFEAGRLSIRDFSGENKHMLMPAEAGLPVFLSPNGKYIFGFSKDSAGNYQLSRLKMIL